MRSMSSIIQQDHVIICRSKSRHLLAFLPLRPVRQVVKKPAATSTSNTDTRKPAAKRKTVLYSFIYTILSFLFCLVYLWLTGLSLIPQIKKECPL